MRKDNRNPLAEKLAEELLDAAISNHRGAEPRAGLEDRVLANLRQQSRAARSVSWNRAPAMIAAAALLIFFAVDHLIYHPAASDPAMVAALGADEPRGGVDSNPIAPIAKAGEREVVTDGVKLAKAFAASKRIFSSSRRRDLALDLNSRRADERADAGLRVEEVRIAEVRLDEIVISNNERQE
ncbi:MAG: hypothetical protein ACREA2_12170 [Blastocatellia bacterium]